jgi:glutamine amidotransferase-like uncharacterized protein
VAFKTNFSGGIVSSFVIAATRLQRVGIIALAALIPITFTARGTTASAAGMPEESTATETPMTASHVPPILLFNGTGTTLSDVKAVEAILSAHRLAYSTANSSQLNGMSESQLKAHKLLIVPGGNSITIGENLRSSTTANIHNAVNAGLHYLGICAGGFFGGYSIYNGLNLTSGVWFDVYSNYGKGTRKAAVEVRDSDGEALDQYWQDGPQFSGWGSIVGEYPDGAPAIVEGRSGNGWVILSGVHAEAPESWRYGMNFTTSAGVDNAYAGTLVLAALNGTALPHY